MLLGDSRVGVLQQRASKMWCMWCIQGRGRGAGCSEPMRIDGHTESDSSGLRERTLHLAVTQRVSPATEPQGAGQFVSGCDGRWLDCAPDVRPWLNSTSRLAEEDWPISFEVGLDEIGEETGDRSVVRTSRFRILKADLPLAL